MTGFTVRPARPDDVDGIRRVARRGWTAAYGEFLSAAVIDAAMAEWYDPDTVQERIDASAVGYFVAVDDEDVVGFANGGPADEDGVASLGAIYVDPDHWREGIGTALLGAFEAFCRDRGFSSVRFGVLTGNEVGRSFYRAYGYEAVDEREGDLFGQPVSEQILSRTLE